MFSFAVVEMDLHLANISFLSTLNVDECDLVPRQSIRYEKICLDYAKSL